MSTDKYSAGGRMSRYVGYTSKVYDHKPLRLTLWVKVVDTATWLIMVTIALGVFCWMIG